MIEPSVLGEHLFFAAAYSVVGFLLLALGYAAFDLVTPGRLGAQIFIEKSISAAIVLSAMMIGLGAVLFAAIWGNSDTGFGPALIWTIAFGLLGIVLQVGAFWALELATPGKMREMITEPGFHPASLAAAGVILAVSAVIIPSIS